MLYLLWIIPAVATWWFAIHKRTARALNNFVAPELQRKLFPQQKFNRQLWQTVLISTALVLLLIAAAGPKWGEREETIYQQARDLVIAVDVSRSMLANDVHPTRLQRAKIDLVDLIKELKGDRAALIAFRAKASMICPLTTDYAFLRQALDGLSPNSAPRGETNIGSAITKALEAFDEEDSSHKAIVLISDGEDLTNKAEELAKIAGEKNIPIYTVGIGSRRGTRIPDKEGHGHYIQHQNKDVVTKLNHDTLYAIAKASGGSYIPVETASMTSTTLGTIYRDHLRQVNARELAETLRTRAVERYQWFLFFAIVLLLAAAYLSRGRIGRKTETQKPLPQKPNAAALTLILITASLSAAVAPVSAQDQSSNTTAEVQQSTNTVKSAVSETAGKKLPPGRKGARCAQKLFKKGKYSEASEAYLSAASGVSRDAERDFKHNAAIALVNDGKYEEAADILRNLALQARSDDRDENRALGIAIYRSAEKLSSDDAEKAAERAELLREAGEAFKEAWRNTPEDRDSRDNVAVILPHLAEAEEQAKILALTKE